MPNVSNVDIRVQTGTTNTYLATWDFVETTRRTITTPGTVHKGAWVTVKPGSRWYNGVGIASFVFNEEWQVLEVRGNRVVIDSNRGGTNHIMSPIHIDNLNGVSGGSSSTVEEKTNYLDHYEVKWYYDTGDNIWFSGNSSGDVKDKYSTYNAPNNALRVKVSIKPVSKTYRANNQDVAYWTGGWVSKEYSTSYAPPNKPPTPSIKMDKFKLTATVDNISDQAGSGNERLDQIEFEIYNGTKKVNVGVVNVQACMASYSYTVAPGGSYRVRCRAINLVHNSKIYSEYTDFTSAQGTIPLPPDKIVSLKALSDTSVYLQWSEVANCKSYKIEYTTKIAYFDSSSEVRSTSVQSTVTHCEIVGLESGEEYFFRVCAVNDQGESAWSEIRSIVIGKKPAAPTTWSSTTTAITGEPLTLYWVHNSQDGSSQSYAELELTVNGVTNTHTIKNTTDEETKDKTSSYVIDTAQYKEGVTIQWRVRTAGITKVYGDWSVQRIVDIYSPVTLEMEITDKDGSQLNVISSFPFYLSVLAGPKTQRPIGYHVSIVSNEVYQTVDNVGDAKMVNSGEEVYSRYFGTNEPLLVEFKPNNIDLQNNIHYTLTCVVSMNSGLTGTASTEFYVDWTEVTYEPDAELGIDGDIYAAYITPYCLDAEGLPITDVLLSVYRREFDGTFTEIATGVDQTKNEYIIDPHPALDYARYRIVATSQTTGAVSYYDPPGYPIDGKSIIIQWDDEWSNFDVTGEDEMEQPPWSGSLLKLPYNIDTTENNSPDVALVEYIGRANAVSYYGTQLGTTATWNVDIDKSDKDTLYALRRLQTWMDDVYVREPSGVGYWANVKVSFNQKHRELTVPVTLNITRVEGGM